MIPTIHLNGTSKDELLDTLGEAANALEMAYVKIKDTAPNGRDFYPQGPEVMKQAESAHMNRLKLVDFVKAEIEALMTAIDRQGESDEQETAGEYAALVEINKIRAKA